MLQETANPGIGDPLAMSTPRRSTLNNITTPVSGRVITRRRASIATIPRPLDSPSASGPAGLTATTKKAVARRVSAGVCGERAELSSKHLDFKPLPEWKKDRFSRPSLSKRPSRLEWVNFHNLFTYQWQYNWILRDFTFLVVPLIKKFFVFGIL